MMDTQKTKSINILKLLIVMGVVLIGWFSAWRIGITPASRLEREFIQMVKESHLSKTPSVQAAIEVTNNSSYVSRRHFCAVADAVTGIPSC